MTEGKRYRKTKELKLNKKRVHKCNIDISHLGRRPGSKSVYLNEISKTVSEGACFTCSGKSFHNFGATTAKTLSPLSLRSIFGISKSIWSADPRERGGT